LIELLVVLGVLFFLVILHLPVFANAYQKAGDSTCLNNKLLLTAAWKMYASDNGGNLCFMPDSPSDKAWCYGGMDYYGSNDDTNVNYITSSIAQLGGYIKNAKWVKCPEDRSAQYGKKGLARVRSVSANQAAGLDSMGLSHSGLWLAGGSGRGPYVVFGKESDIAQIGSSMLWIFIDEHPDSINDGGFAFCMTMNDWVDVPSVAHNNATCISFADGHVELHPFQRPDVISAPTYGSFVSPIRVLNNPDVLWFQARTSCKQ